MCRQHVAIIGAFISKAKIKQKKLLHVDNVAANVK